MRTIKLLGLGFIAVLALAVTASAASAHEFEYTGKVGDPLLASAVTSQLFEAGFGTVHCSELKIDNGVIKALKSETQEADVLYTSCIASTPLGNLKVDEPILALYNFNANGTTQVLSPVKFTILSSPGSELCTITVSTQTVSGISYSNVGSMINVIANSTGISWTSNKSLVCGSGGATGTYTGTSLVSGDTGVLSWK